MKSDAIQKSLMRLTSKANSLDGIIIAIGIGALVLGILVDVFIIRLLCLVLVFGVAGLIVIAMRAKPFEASRGGSMRGHSEENVSSRNYSQSESAMKKLVFDDLQSAHHASDAYDEPEIVNQGVPADEGSQRSSFVSLPTIERSSSIFRAAGSEVQSPEKVFQISDFFDVDSAIFKSESEPRTEFDFLLNKVLVLIKEMVFAHSVAFFWANNEKQQMVLEARISDSPVFMKGRRFGMGHDLLSKVALTGKPQLITDVNPLSEGELIRYYDTPESIKSFIGVPVYFSKPSDVHAVERPVAVIAIDSKVEDQYGHETLVLLGHYTKLISALIKSYNEKYELLISSELLRSIRRLQEKIRNNSNLTTILQALAEETSKLVNWDFLSIVLYDEHKHAWIARKVSNRGYEEGYILTDQQIDFPNSIVGDSIRHNAHRIVDDLDQSEMPRYVADEKITKAGSFIAVPITSLHKCYGSLNLESREKMNFSRQDVDTLYRLTENVASALEILFMQELIHEYVIIDETTGVYSKKFFLQRMEEELQRSDENGTDLSMLFITVDKAMDVATRFGKDGFERVMFSLAKAIRSSVRQYEIVGRYDHNRFGVLLLNTPANDAYLWAEKIRKNVAAQVISLDGKSFSITISTGVCGVLDGMKKEELVGNTITVLNKAAESGGNAVRVY